MLPRGVVFLVYISFFIIQVSVIFLPDQNIDKTHFSFCHKFEIWVLRRPSWHPWTLMLPRGVVFLVYISFFIIQISVIFLPDQNIDKARFSFFHKFEIWVLRRPSRHSLLSRILLLIFYLLKSHGIWDSYGHFTFPCWFELSIFFLYSASNFSLQVYIS